MRRKRLIIALVSLGLLAAVGGTAGYVLNSERGLYWAFEFAARVIPGQLHVAQLHGRLLGPIEFKGLVYDSADAKVTIERASVDWRPSALLTGRFHVTRLHLADVTIVTKTRAEAAPRATSASHVLAPPLAVTLDDARVVHLRLERPGAQAPLTIERVELHGSANDKRVRIGALRVAADTWSLSVEGHVAPRAPYRMQLHTRWRLQPPGRGPFEGAGRVAGSVRQLRLSQTLTKPSRVELQANLMDVLKAPRWQGQLRFEGLRLQDWVGGARAVRLGGEAQGKGTFSRFQANVDLKAHDAELGELDATAQLSRSADRWRLDRLVASAPGTPARLSAHGQLDRAAGDRFDLQAQWQALRWPLSGQAQFTSEQGEASIQGTPGQYRVALGGELTAAGTALGRWQAEGAGDRRSLRLTRLSGDPIGGRVQGHGRIAWRPSPSWSLSVTGQGLDPARRWAEWPGRLDFALEHSGRRVKGMLDTDTHLIHLDGKLRGQPLKASLALRTQGPNLALSDAAITLGKASLSANGTVTRTWALRWSLVAPELAAVLPDAQGSVNANGQLKGPRERPAIALHLEADKVAWRDYGVTQAKIEAALDLTDRAPSTLHADARELLLPDGVVETLNVEASGRAARHRITITAHSGTAALRVAVDGSLGQAHWRGRLVQMNLTAKPLGQWTLARAGDVTVSRAGVDVAQSCFTAAPARLCLQGAWQRREGWHGALEARQLALAVFDPWLPPDVHLTGVADATARLALSAQSRRADLKLSLPAGTMSYAPKGGAMQAAPYRDGRLRVTTTNGALHGQLQLNIGKGGQLRGELRLPRFADVQTRLADQPVAATFEARRIGLRWLPAVFPELANADGDLETGIVVGATLGSPSIRGELTVERASAEVPRLGLNLHGIALRVHTSKPDRLAFEGRIASGDGTLALRGHVDTNVLRGGGAALTLEGEKITLANIPEAKVIASPKLALRVEDYQAHLTGEVRIPQAHLEPGKYKPPVSASPDVVIIGAEQTRPPRTRWRLHTRVSIVLGDAVNFDGFGLNGKLGGALIAVDEPGKPTTGLGEIRVTDGKYKVYGRELTVEQGRLLFAGGPITNPNVDARAVRRIGDIVVGVRAQGPLKTPQFSLFSDPSMDQSDILSYLVVGRPLNAASKSEGNLIYAAATSLGLKGGELLAKSIGTTFGIQDVQITEQVTTQRTTTQPALLPGGQPVTTQQSTAQPALLLGTYLSPRLYVAYTVGLFEPSQVLQFRFRLTPHWELRTESGSVSSGADLLYSIER